MKRFIHTLKWFFLPLLVMALILFFLPFDKSFRYHYIHDNCFDRGSFIYQRIFENDMPIDIAFIGTSHTLNAVDDSLIENNMADTAAHIANLSFCWLGNDLQYVIVKDLLEQKHPKLIVLEVRETESAFSHIMYPYLADANDVLKPSSITNKFYFKNIFVALKTRLSFLRSEIFQTDLNYFDKVDNYGYEARNDTPLVNIFIESRISHSEMKFNQPGDFILNLNALYPDSFIRKIKDLAEKNNCRIAFLYLPSYGATESKPMYPSIYEENGIIFSPPSSILNDTLNWSNTGHMNTAGAHLLSIWMSEQLNKQK